MSVSADSKINMSLDELIKMKQKEGPKKRTKKPVVSAKPSAAGTRKGRGKFLAQNSTSTTSVKIAKTVGNAKAKRAAALDQKRGISTTSKPTKAQVTKAINTQLKKIVPKQKMKITFKPADLPKTTDKAVAQQIKAVLSKQKGSGNNNPKSKVFGTSLNRPEGKGKKNGNNSARRIKL